MEKQKYYFLVELCGADGFCQNLGTDREKAVETLYDRWSYLTRKEKQKVDRFEICYGYESCDVDEEYEGITDCLYEDDECDVIEDIFRTCERCRRRYAFDSGYHTEDTSEDICAKCFQQDTHCFTCENCGRHYALDVSKADTSDDEYVGDYLYCTECR